MTSGQGENQLGLHVAIFRRRLCQKQTCYCSTKLLTSKCWTIHKLVLLAFIHLYLKYYYLWHWSVKVSSTFNLEF